MTNKICLRDFNNMSLQDRQLYLQKRGVYPIVNTKPQKPITNGWLLLAELIKTRFKEGANNGK